MTDCLFCKIAQGEISSDVVHETDQILAFKDIGPQAPVHILIIPKKHIATLNDLTDNDTELIGRMVIAAKDIAREFDIEKNGYRTVFNCNRHGGQEVSHIHLHLLGGRQMKWPPG